MKPLLPALSAALLAFGAAPALAEEPSRAEVNRFVEAVRAIGCVVENDDQAEAVEAATGFDEARLGQIVNLLLETGDAEVLPTMEGLRLTTEGCR